MDGDGKPNGDDSAIMITPPTGIEEIAPTIAMADATSPPASPGPATPNYEASGSSASREPLQPRPSFIRNELTRRTHGKSVLFESYRNMVQKSDEDEDSPSVEVSVEKPVVEDESDAPFQDIEEPIAGRQLTRAISKRQVHLQWKDIYQSVPGVSRQILKDITGFGGSGQMIAIMGPSGCGKSSLLNILANRNPNYSGNVYYNSRVLEKKDVKYRKSIGFCVQDDCFMAHLTVREQLVYSAKLRLPSTKTEDEINKLVDRILVELGLVACQNTAIGNEFIRGVSGGERKRCNIGVELISNPSVLFLDEPTSGLDSFSSKTTVQLCKDLAVQGGRIVIMSIHQPRSDIWDMMDTILLMSAGEIVYFGPGGTEVMDFFASLDYRNPEDTNAADFLLDLVAAENLKRLAGGGESASTNVARVVAAYKLAKGAYLPATLMAKKPALQKIVSQVNKGPQEPIAHEIIRKTRILTKRSIGNNFKNKRFIIAKILQSLITAIIIGLIFLQIPTDQTGPQDRFGVIFLMAMNLSFPVASGVVEVFIKERAVFFREYASMMYSPLPYYASKFCSEIPIIMMTVLIQGTLIYWMVGLQANAGKYFLFLVFMAVLVLIASAIGLTFGALCANATQASAYVSLILFISISFSGYLRNESNIPVFLIWVQYISFVRYCYHALAINEFEGLVFSCPSSDLITAPGSNTTYCPIPNGEAVLINQDFPPSSFSSCIGAMFAFAVGWNILAYSQLRRAAQKNSG